MLKNIRGRQIQPTVDRELVKDYFPPPKTRKVVIFLDRDDTLIRDYGDATHKKIPKFNDYLVMHLKLILVKLKKQAVIILVTNQSRINQNKTSVRNMNNFHSILVFVCWLKGIKIQRIISCPHVSEQDCLCRKPKPHTIVVATQYFHARHLPKFFIGNSASDLYAGLNSDCYTILLDQIQEDFRTADKPLKYLGCFDENRNLSMAILDLIG